MTEQTQESKQISVNAQYIKDLSFENPKSDDVNISKVKINNFINVP